MVNYYSLPSRYIFAIALSVAKDRRTGTDKDMINYYSLPSRYLLAVSLAVLAVTSTQFTEQENGEKYRLEGKFLTL